MDSLSLHTIQPASGARKRRRRVGRGNASRGTYSGRGQKGQRARSGGRGGLKFKGLKAQLQQLPKKRGFTSHAVRPLTVSLADLDRFDDGATVSPTVLKRAGVIRKTANGVKVLGSGMLKKKITLVGCAVTKGAREKIEAARGAVI